MSSNRAKAFYDDLYEFEPQTENQKKAYDAWDEGDNLVLYLPANPQSGDTVSVIEVGGNLTYDTSLIMRAQGIGTRVQGDATGTTIGIGGTTPYSAGELIVQTPNAGFTLVYLGGTDSNGEIVSSAVQGWWLKEV